MEERKHSKNELPPNPLDELERELEAKAEEYAELRAQLGGQSIMLWFAARLREARRERANQLLTIRQAAAITGHATETLREMVRDGRLPDSRPDGSQGEIRIARKYLPRKPRSRGDDGPSPSSTEEILDEVARRSRRDP